MKHSIHPVPYPLIVEGSNRYASLEMAQAAALPVVAQVLAEVFRNNGWKGRSDCDMLDPEGDDDEREMSVQSG